MSSLPASKAHSLLPSGSPDASDQTGATGSQGKTDRKSIHVEPGWIDAYDVGPDRVRVEVAVHNAGPERSQPQLLRVESSVLGAFVPWHPLVSMRLPSIEPRGTWTVASEVSRPPRPVAGAALSSRIANLLSRHPMERLFRIDTQALGVATDSPHWDRVLPPDVFEMMGHRRPEWSGNLRVHLGGETTTRARARALRTQPGRQNHALFLVGSRPGEYAFELRGSAKVCHALLTWKDGKTLVPLLEAQQGGRSEWVQLDPWTPVILSVLPQTGARRTPVEVRVHRRKGAAVSELEFDFDSQAMGPGCFLD